jgi:hypothetical protein
MSEYQPSTRLAKRPKLDLPTDGTTFAVPDPNAPPSALPTAAMEPPMGRSKFQPSSKLRTRPQLNTSMVASTSALPERPAPSPVPIAVTPPATRPTYQQCFSEAVVPASQFYGLESSFGDVQEGGDRRVRFKYPLVEGTPLRIRQSTVNEDRMEGIVEAKVELPPPPSLPLPPPPIPPRSTRPVFLCHPPTLPIVTIPPTLSSPASDPIEFPSTPDDDIRTLTSAEEHSSPKWPRSQTPSSPSSIASPSPIPETEEEEQVDQLADDTSDDEVEFVEGNQKEMVGIAEADDMWASGRVLKGKERAVEDSGEGMMEESAASVRSFLLRPTIEEMMKDLGLESGGGEEIRGIEVRTTAKEKKANLLSRLLEAELHLAAGVEQLHDCLNTYVANNSKFEL